MENANSPEYLEKIKNQLIENLKRTAHVPSVQMQDVPPDFPHTLTEEEEAELDDLDEDENKDVRMTQRQWEKQREPDNEYEESDNEELDRANGVQPQNGESGRKRPFTDYQKSDLDEESGAPTPTNGNNPENVLKSKEVDEVMEDAQPEKETEPEGIAEQEEQLKQAQKPESQLDGDGDVDMDGPPSVLVRVSNNAHVEEEDVGSPKAAPPVQSPKPAEKEPEAATSLETVADRESLDQASGDKVAQPVDEATTGKAPEASGDAMEVDEPKSESVAVQEGEKTGAASAAADDKPVEGGNEGSKPEE
jgi:histone deacetylase 1/2